jgi:hypothetical protein
MLARVVVHDGGGEDLAERAAARLASMGYHDISLMAGGTRARAGPGSSCSPGQRTEQGPGELVEHRCGTPYRRCRAEAAAGEEVPTADSRPIGEFRNMSIPAP